MNKISQEIKIWEEDNILASKDKSKENNTKFVNQL